MYKYLHRYGYPFVTLTRFPAHAFNRYRCHWYPLPFRHHNIKLRYTPFKYLV